MEELDRAACHTNGPPIRHRAHDYFGTLTVAEQGINLRTCYLIRETVVCGKLPAPGFNGKKLHCSHKGDRIRTEILGGIL